MNQEKIICRCKNVTKGDLLKAIGQGADSYKEISQVTGAGTKCGECKKKVKLFIKKQLAKKQPGK